MIKSRETTKNKSRPCNTAKAFLIQETSPREFMLDEPQAKRFLSL